MFSIVLTTSLFAMNGEMQPFLLPEAPLVQGEKGEKGEKKKGEGKKKEKLVAEPLGAPTRAGTTFCPTCQPQVSYCGSGGCHQSNGCHHGRMKGRCKSRGGRCGRGCR